MKTVFVSSIQRDFADVRDAASKAIESLDMHPLMAETTGASPDSPRGALLERVREASIFLLLLGLRYGETGETGRSPTEDEYEEAARLNKPILVLKQNGAMEPAQEDFLSRTRGSWDEGKLSGSFDGPADVGLEIVKAIRAYEGRMAAGVDASLASDAQTRALELAEGDERTDTSGSGSKARFIAVPVVRGPLLDALALEDPELLEAVQMMARTSQLVSNPMGLSSRVSASGIRLQGKAEGAWEELRFAVGTDGAILAEGAVGGQAGFLASSVIDAGRLRELVERAQTFALAVWERIDLGHDVRESALTLAVPEANHKVYAETEVAGSMSMPMSMPNLLVAPEPARLVRRENLGEKTTRMLIAELKRRFADEGAIHRG